MIEYTSLLSDNLISLIHSLFVLDIRGIDFKGVDIKELILKILMLKEFIYVNESV